MEYDGTFYAPIGNFMAEAYDDFGFTHKTQHQVDFLADALTLQPDARILDVGCGTGRHSLELARRGYRTMGVDISEGMVNVGRRQAAEEDLPAEFHMADARDLRFEHEFDAAICLCEGAFGLAGNEEGHRRILAGVACALNPGAPFILTAINVLKVARQLDIDESGSLQPTESSGDHKTVEFDPYTCTSRQLMFAIRWVKPARSRSLPRPSHTGSFPGCSGMPASRSREDTGRTRETQSGWTTPS